MLNQSDDGFSDSNSSDSNEMVYDWTVNKDYPLLKDDDDGLTEESLERKKDLLNKSVSDKSEEVSVSKKSKTKDTSKKKKDDSEVDEKDLVKVVETEKTNGFFDIRNEMINNFNDLSKMILSIKPSKQTFKNVCLPDDRLLKEINDLILKKKENSQIIEELDKKIDSLDKVVIEKNERYVLDEKINQLNNDYYRLKNMEISLEPLNLELSLLEKEIENKQKECADASKAFNDKEISIMDNINQLECKIRDKLKMKEDLQELLAKNTNKKQILREKIEYLKETRYNLVYSTVNTFALAALNNLNLNEKEDYSGSNVKSILQDAVNLTINSVEVEENS